MHLPTCTYPRKYVYRIERSAIKHAFIDMILTNP
jgi:hypothetical protein